MAIDGASAEPRPSLVRRISEHAAFGVVLVLLVAFLGLVVVLYVTHTTAKVDGESMKPGLLPEDILLVTKGYDNPVRGDVIVINAPSHPTIQPGTQLVKRVIAIPGDEIKVVEGVAFVNGKRESGNYRLEFSPQDIGMPLTTVPAGEIVVLGDNRPISEDSRIFGPVPLDLVIGRVVAVIAPINRYKRVD